MLSNKLFQRYFEEVLIFFPLLELKLFGDPSVVEEKGSSNVINFVGGIIGKSDMSGQKGPNYWRLVNTQGSN